MMSGNTRVCTDCNEGKDLECFAVANKQNGYRMLQCRPCSNARTRTQTATLLRTPKTCLRCDKLTEGMSFPPLSKVCKACLNKAHQYLPTGAGARECTGRQVQSPRYRIF